MNDPSPDDEIDAQLVERARAGDDRAFADLVRRHQRRALRLAMAICGSMEEAEDAVQDAFVKAHGALDRVHPHAPVRPWLLQVVANTARNHRRSTWRRTAAHRRAAARAPEAEMSSVNDHPDDLAVRAVVDDALWAAVAGLNERDRRIVALRYFAGLSEAETAATLDVAPGTVKSRTARALGRLRAELEGAVDD